MNMIAPRRRRLVIVGNGMAGIRTLEEILARAPQAYAVTVFGAEPHGNYDRIQLSPVLSGEKTFETIVTHDRAWYEANDIELIAGEPVVAIDRAVRTVTGTAGTTRTYDTLLLATGSDPVILPIPGADLPGVLGFRSIADVDTMLGAARDGAAAVVIGGGLLGLEAANGLVRQGVRTTVLHIMPTLMERQLDPDSAALLRQDLERRGLEVITGANTRMILGDDRVRAVQLADGREIPADLVVMAAGIRPNAALARAAGLAMNRGIIVDDTMLTSDPRIYAVGECVEHRGVVPGLVAPIWDMAKVCADNLTGVADTLYVPAVSGTRLKVTGIDMFSAGDFTGDDTAEVIVLRDPSQGIHKRIVLRDDRLIGAVLYGDAADAGWYFDLLKSGTDIADMRDMLVFGAAAAGADQTAGVEALPDTAEICGCNGVPKGRILAAIAEYGLTTVEAVRRRTKASASCGSCTFQVEALLKLALGEGFAAGPAVKTVCSCTTMGHDQVRAAIAERKPTTIQATMRALGWATPDGCATCRPALNYYLLCAWPAEYRDDPRARFVNERMHANIQKDGTYSVVPRMWGGLTTASELRAIADVVDKYAIPSVKITGGQRIDLFGVRKEQLPHVWRDLNAAGMVSGHAYGKALRTVKTCVGSEWCRFGTRDSTAMGVAIEKMCWGSWTPHKVKMAVSGCPRNCAEVTIKDFGVMATESGWDIHVGGNGGIKLRGTELLAKVTTEAEVLEYCGAYMQLYREEARYLERTAHWIERVGFDYIRDRLSDPAARSMLHQRFREGQRQAQRDPWMDRAAGIEAHEFAPLATME